MIETRYMYKNSYTESFKQFASKDYLRRKKLEIKRVKKGLVLPLKVSEAGGPLLGYGGVLDSNGEYVMESAQIGKGGTADRFVGKYDFDPHKVVYSDEEVIYIGALPLHWGHFLVDMVYRFWVFNDIQNENKKIVYCANGQNFKGPQLEFIKMLGIDEKRLFRIDKPTCFKEVDVPEPAYMACDYYTIDYRNIFTRVVNNLDSISLQSYEKIYLSRGHFRKAKRSEIGEKHIEDNFLRNGFHVLYMEELSLKEQIFYITSSKVIAALSGTLCHNIMFANPNTTLILLNKTHLINTHQVLINQAVGCKVVYVDVYKEPFKKFPKSYGSGPFLLEEDSLEKYFVDQGMKIKKKPFYMRWNDFARYVYVCIRQSMQEKMEQLYSDIYHWTCRHPFIINKLRLLKKVVYR